jgi:hypothetical protein
MPTNKASNLQSTSSCTYTLLIWHLRPVSILIVSKVPLYINIDLISIFYSPALPIDTTVSQVYADYLRYLFQHTKAFFERAVLGGYEIWQSLSESIDVIIAHPNGWGTREQGVLRTAAVAAGISTSAESHGKISFVSEAEASIHFCLTSSQLIGSLEVGDALTEFLLEANSSS